MGITSNPLLVSMKGNVMQEISEEMQKQMLESQAKRRWQLVRKNGAQVIKSKRCRRILKKSRAGLRGYRSRTANGIHKRVKTLQKLIPNSDSSMGLEGLFRETADYILSLQMRVNLMQIMVKILTSGSDE